ncbi:MAG: class I SAM-dependent methyltransferase [Flavobacteriaceae bacterium]
MFLDVIELRDFYAEATGIVVRRILATRLQRLWPDVREQSIAGIGYATPYLAIFRGRAGRVLALMPAAQGVVRWPIEGASASALVDELDLPLTDAAIDRAIVAHGLESTNDPAAMLEEAWRVLKPGGRLIIVVANRRGVWARTDTSPFGHGRPFSRSQLSRLLRNAGFSPEQWVDALYVPPFRYRPLLRFATAFERIGAFLRLPMSGAIIVEAVKRAHGGQAVRVRQQARRVPVLAGQPVSAMDAPASRRDAS